MTNSTPVAGWYTDPHGERDLRYWDGASWTPHTYAHPSTPTDPWARPTLGSPALAGGDPFVTDSMPGDRRGLPWWLWATIAAVVVGLGALAVYGVASLSTAFETFEQEDAPDTAPLTDDLSDDVSEDEDDFDYYSAEGTVTWVTPQELASFEVHRSWREDMEKALEYDPSIEYALAGSWNLDGESFEDTWHYMYVWEYADQPDDGLTIEEVCEENYSNLLYYEDIHVITRVTDTFKTSQGYEGWNEDLTFVDAEGFSRRGYLTVVTNGTDWVIFDVTENAGGHEDSRIADMVDSVIFLSD